MTKRRHSDSFIVTIDKDEQVHLVDQLELNKYSLKANIDLIGQLVAFNEKEGNRDDLVDTATGAARHWLRPKRKIKA
jgi:hypothetical protein